MRKILRIVSEFAAIGVIAGAATAAEPDAVSLAAVEISHVPPILTAKWDNALHRHRKATPNAGELGDWQLFLGSLSQHSRDDQVERVNAYVNAFRYVPDVRNWGKSDYWASPEELFRRGGDCEDYVIAKYLSLRAVGVPARDLRVLVLHDSRRDLAHAVLLWLHDDHTLVLDNLYQNVMTWDAVGEFYRPLYSLNEDSAWIYTASG